VETVPTEQGDRHGPTHLGDGYAAASLARLLEAKVDPAVELPFVRPIISTRHD
jgi:hypothetical protein